MVGEEQFSGWAEYYDAIYEDQEEDTDFYLNEMEKADGKVLEIGCGTGRIYLEALEKGIDIYGFDVSKEMLNKLCEKAEKRNLDPQVRKADMTNFSYEEKFSLIVIPFRTYLHNLTVEEQIQTLKKCREHLKDNGRLIINFYLPNFEIISQQNGETSESELEIDGETYRRQVTVEWKSEIEQIRHIRNELYSPDGEKVWESDFQTKLVSKSEFELLLRLTGFSNWKVYGDFNKEELESTDQEAVWEVRK